MQKTFTHLVAIATVASTLAGCAGSYRAIQPERITSYQSTSGKGGPVEFSYRYGALLTHGPNKKYVKKERKRGYQLVAVQVKNNTASELNFSRDLELLFGDRPIQPVGSLQASEDLKQGVAIYLLYFLGIGQIGGTTDPVTGVTSGGTLFPWGPFVGIGNMIGAGTANKNMRNELARYDMTNKVIRPGETVYGLLPLRETNVAPLKLTLRNSATTIAPATAPAATPATPAPAGSN